MAINTRAEFIRLLDLRNHHPHLQATIDAELQQTFAQTHAIFVLDMSGFSRLTLKHGIIHFLAAFRRLCAIAHPLIKQHQGLLIKEEADDIFAVFPTVSLALDAAIALLNTLHTTNDTLPNSLKIEVGIGIGYGEVLMIENRDVFGNEMNMASKLGEDLARPNEILLTDAAYASLNPNPYPWQHLELSTSGVVVTAHKVVVPLPNWA